MVPRENGALSPCCTAEVKMCEYWRWCAGHAAKLLFSVGCCSQPQKMILECMVLKFGQYFWWELFPGLRMQAQKKRKEKKWLQKAAALSYGCLEGAGSIRFKESGKKSAVTHILIVYSSHFVYFYASKQKMESSDLLLDCLGLLSGCTFSPCLV